MKDNDCINTLVKLMTHLLLSSIFLDFYRFLYTNFTQQSSSIILNDFCYQSIKII